MPDGTVSGERLAAYLQRIERLEEEKAELMADIREIYAEAKGDGFDPRTMRKIVRLRAMDDGARQEEEDLLNTYLAALGMLDGPAAAG